MLPNIIKYVKLTTVLNFLTASNCFTSVKSKSIKIVAAKQATRGLNIYLQLQYIVLF